MSTRGFVGFVIDGTEKITYNHSDSYPGWLGVNVLSWLREADTAEAADQARALRVVDPESTPTDKDIERLRGCADLNVGRQTLDSWYVLLRHNQGNPGAMLQAGVVEDASDFPTDSLFAEYGYVVDFDARLLEAYAGFQKLPHGEGRFASRPRLGDDYYPVKLVGSWPFTDLPDDVTFCETVDPPEAEINS
jgi:hypothetical protein